MGYGPSDKYYTPQVKALLEKQTGREQITGHKFERLHP